jgi:hypothetical protein
MNNTGLNTISRRLLGTMNAAYEEAKRATEEAKRAAEEAEYAAAKAREAAAASRLSQAVVAGHAASLKNAMRTGNYRRHRSKMGGSRGRGRKGRKGTRRGRR